MAIKYTNPFALIEKMDVDLDKRRVCGYFSTWDTIDTYNERMMKGCYAKSIAENGPASTRPRIQHLYNHNSWDGMPIAKIDVLKEDEIGLYFESVFAKTQRGNDVLTLYQEGILREHSVGYKTIQVRRMEGQPAEVQEVKLYEGSTVLWGANEDALLVGIKSAPEAMDYIKNIRRVLRSASISDEVGSMLELNLRSLESLVDDGAADGTPPKAEPTIDLCAMYREL